MGKYHIGDIDTDDDHSLKREFSIEDEFVPFSDDNGSDVVMVSNKVLAQNQTSRLIILI